jgi:hypothetical protein
MKSVKALLKNHAQPIAATDTEDVHMVDIVDIQPGTGQENSREEDLAENEDIGLCTTCVKTRSDGGLTGNQLNVLSSHSNCYIPTYVDRSFYP